MKTIGIDLSGPRNHAETCLVSFEEQGNEIHLSDVCEGADDHQILEAISSLDPKDQIIIGMDAPLSYNFKGGDRLSDSELRRFVKSQGGRVGIMPPTMMRMVYLTLRGVQLTHLLESLKPGFNLEIVEVHPGACMILRGAAAGDVRSFKSDPSARGRLLDWLETKGLRGICRPHGQTVSDHYVAACAAALAAWQWSLGKSVWRFAANPPHHPYDFTC